MKTEYKTEAKAEKPLGEVEKHLIRLAVFLLIGALGGLVLGIPGSLITSYLVGMIIGHNRMKWNKIDIALGYISVLVGMLLSMFNQIGWTHHPFVGIILTLVAYFIGYRIGLRHL